MIRYNQMLFRALLLVSLAFLSMANKSCKKEDEKPPEPEAKRLLKHRVELSQISSPAIELPGGGFFDFQFVASSQLYDVLMEDGHFTFPYTFSPAPRTQAQFRQQNFSQRDVQLFSLLMGVAPSASEKILPSPDEDVACLVNMPHAYIAGSIRAFEMLSKSGFYLGFGLNGGHDASVFPSVSIMVQKAQLDLGVVSYSSIRRRTLAVGSATSKQTQVDINLSINFGNFKLGPKYFFQSPLAGVTKNALKMAVNQLSDSMKKEQWYTRVRSNVDARILLEGGLDVGLMEGDELEIFGEEHEWEGRPCKSRYLGSVQTEEPIALVRITKVSDAFSLAEPIKLTDWNPQTGDRVFVKTLVPLPKEKKP